MFNILIIDDHNLLAESLSLRIKDLDFVKSIEVRTDINDFDLVEFASFDIILLDIMLDDNKTTIQFIPKIKKINPKIKVIALTSNLDRLTMKLVYDNNADGYLNKATKFDDFVINLKTVINNQKYFPDILTQNLTSNPEVKSITLDNSHNLSNRELEILKLMSLNNSNQEISSLLNISIRTVETHRKNLFYKFKVNTLNSLIKEAKSKLLI